MNRRAVAVGSRYATYPTYPVSVGSAAFSWGVVSTSISGIWTVHSGDLFEEEPLVASVPEPVYDGPTAPIEDLDKYEALF